MGRYCSPEPLTIIVLCVLPIQYVAILRCIEPNTHQKGPIFLQSYLLKKNFLIGSAIFSLRILFSATINQCRAYGMPPAGICHCNMTDIIYKHPPQTFRPDFFIFLVYRHFWALFYVGIRNKNKISVMPELHL